MSDLKTKKTKKSVSMFISGVKDEQKRKDSKDLLKIFSSATGLRPNLWGTSIIGYGTYHYKGTGGREGDWPLTGFSPRKQFLTIYIMPGFKKYKIIMKDLGKFKTSVSCLYVNKLSDIDSKKLKRLISYSVRDMKKRYQVSQSK